MISVKHLSHAYDLHPALQSVSFEVPKGQILGLLGPNGAGKTTTLQALTGLLIPDQGELTVAGINMRQQPLLAQQHMGYLPDQPPLYGHLSAREHLRLICRLRGLPKPRWSAAIDAVVERCQLQDRLKQYPHQLSRGYCQRLGLAMTLIHEPEVLILDEPTTGLDPQQIHATRETLRALKGEHTLVLSSHLLAEVEAICDQVVILNQGRVVAQGHPQHLMSAQSPSFRLRLRPSPLASAQPAAPEALHEALAAESLGAPEVTLLSPGPLTADAKTLGLRLRFADATLLAPSSDQTAIQTRLIQTILALDWEVLELTAESTASLESVFLAMVEPVEQEGHSEV